MSEYGYFCPFYNYFIAFFHCYKKLILNPSKSTLFTRMLLILICRTLWLFFHWSTMPYHKYHLLACVRNYKNYLYTIQRLSNRQFSIHVGYSCLPKPNFFNKALLLVARPLKRSKRISGDSLLPLLKMCCSNAWATSALKIPFS